MKSDANTMASQWDEMARCNAIYSVCSAEVFENAGDAELARFWQGGREQVDLFLADIPLNQLAECDMVEIGCDLGRMTHRFAQLFRHVYAVDVSREMLTRAKSIWSSLDNVSFTLGNGMDLQPIASGSVHFVFSYLVLQHAPDPEIVLTYIRESARVLLPGGVAFLQFRTSASPTVRQRLALLLPAPVRGALRALKARSRRANASSDRLPLEIEFAEQYEAWRGCSVSPDAVESLTVEVGFPIEKVTGIGTQYTFYTLRKTSAEPTYALA